MNSECVHTRTVLRPPRLDFPWPPGGGVGGLSTSEEQPASVVPISLFISGITLKTFFIFYFVSLVVF